VSKVVRRSWIEELSLVAGENDGYIRTEDMTHRNVSASWLSLLASKGRLEKIGHGLYRVPGWPISRLTPYKEAALWANRRAVIAGEAALDLWQLSDANPRKIDLIVDLKYKPRKTGGERYRLFQRSLAENEVTDFDGLRVLTPYAAIEDATKKGVATKLIVRAIEVAQAQELVTKRQAARLLVGLDGRESA